MAIGRLPQSQDNYIITLRQRGFVIIFMNKKEKSCFKGKGLGTTNKQLAVSVKLPPEVDKVVRSLPNRSDWLRETIAQRLERDGLLPSKSS